MCQARSQPPFPSQSGYWMRRMRALRMPARIFMRDGSSAAERLPSRVSDGVAEIFLDAQQLVVLRHAVGARQRPGLDLQRIGADCDVRDRGVLRLARAVRD